ncbi:hypothetical protein CK203_109018 [Vitis vinifera]|uniref:Uncharacterized protein n=1 Tax=Vitis vinifera TaxID=29760 RepID=A0A438FEK3_VITVI|nr:hypothetical protein CK203_109018 [Vitis vinifera]
MAKTRGAKTPSPLAHNIRPRALLMRDSMSKAPQAPVIPPSKDRALPSPPQQRRPMVTQPPIEGNLDCQARPFHSELCFDRETFKHQSELRDSFHLLQKYHLEHLMTPRDFFYLQVALYFYQSMTTHCVLDPTFIHFTIDGRHGILGARHIAEALHILYEPEGASTQHVSSGCAPTLQHISTSGDGAKEMSYTRGLVQDIRGFLIWPSSFDYDRSIFTLKRRSTGRSYREQMPFHCLSLGCSVQQVEIPTEIITPALAAPSTVLTPEATSSAPLTTPGTPPVVPTTSAPPSSKFTITISISEFRGDSWFLIGVSADSCPAGVP